MQIATLLVLPVSVLFLALALWFVQLHPKPADEERAAGSAGEGTDGEAKEAEEAGKRTGGDGL